MRIDDEADAIRFRYWAISACFQPSKIATVLANCLTPDQIRNALDELMMADPNWPHKLQFQGAFAREAEALKNDANTGHDRGPDTTQTN